MGHYRASTATAGAGSAAADGRGGGARATRVGAGEGAARVGDGRERREGEERVTGEGRRQKCSTRRSHLLVVSIE